MLCSVGVELVGGRIVMRWAVRGVKALPFTSTEPGTFQNDKYGKLKLDIAIVWRHTKTPQSICHPPAFLAHRLYTNLHYHTLSTITNFTYKRCPPHSPPSRPPNAPNGATTRASSPARTPIAVRANCAAVLDIMGLSVLCSYAPNLICTHCNGFR